MRIRRSRVHSLRACRVPVQFGASPRAGGNQGSRAFHRHDRNAGVSIWTSLDLSQGFCGLAEVLSIRDQPRKARLVRLASGRLHRRSALASPD
jgi:hypothetical protein